ncbi:MAG TPA: hypothetical protein VIM76_08010 [Candidatus Dormibacteraeota bacterium]
MADELQPDRARGKVATAAMLVGLIAVAGIVGTVLSMQQRPLFHPRLLPIVAPSLPPAFSANPTPGRGPVSAFGFSVADDPAVHRVVLFGGVDSYDETWLWNGNRWSRAQPRTSPPGRFQAAAAYDPETRLVMLFGGRLPSGQIADDTWAWSGATWRELDSGAGTQPPGEGALMAWDNAKREMVLVATAANAAGGETWVWRGSHWSRQTGGEPPPTPIAGEMAFDPASSALLFVSGLSPPLGPGMTTWRFDGRGWLQLPATPPQSTAGLALDPMSGRLLLCSDPTPDAFPQLWRWSGTGWEGVPQSNLSIEQGVEVTDLDRGEFLMFGFDAPPAQSRPQLIRVWAWGGHSWQQTGSTQTG